jgi:large subunit ribosomal protein L25
MSETRLTAQLRTEFGKGAARRTRRAGLVPAVLYGHGSETRHLSLPALEFARAIKGGANTVLTLQIDGEEQLALPRAIVRHPLRDYFEHVDLLTVRRGEKVHVEVPVHLVGEAAPGTLVLHELNTLAIEVDALSIPDRLEVSIDRHEAGSQITASQVTLPEGATLVTDPDNTVVAVQVAPTAEQLSGEEGLEGTAEQAATEEAATPAESSDEG